MDATIRSVCAPSMSRPPEAAVSFQGCPGRVRPSPNNPITQYRHQLRVAGVAALMEAPLIGVASHGSSFIRRSGLLLCRCGTSFGDGVNLCVRGLTSPQLHLWAR